VSLVYDRAGRSNGIAYVTYEHADDARQAVREFDGANAKGQPIRLAQVPSGPAGGRPRYNDTGSSRSLADRITRPARPSRSRSPIRHSDVSGPAPRDVDRYVPGRRGESRSPAPRRRDGRRPGERRGGDRGGRGGRDRGERLAKDGRPKKTQDELDAEMDDYWGAKNGDGAKEDEVGTASEAAPATSKPVDDDIDMDIL
jgi:THO complex subunit 4